MLDELADLLGIRPQVAEITRRAMNGEIDFVAALEARVALLKGMKASGARGSGRADSADAGRAGAGRDDARARVPRPRWCRAGSRSSPSGLGRTSVSTASSPTGSTSMAGPDRRYRAAADRDRRDQAGSPAGSRGRIRHRAGADNRRRRRCQRSADAGGRRHRESRSAPSPRSPRLRAGVSTTPI